MTRSVNPSDPDHTEVEFDFANYALPVGATFNPTVVFSNTLPYLKLSGDSGQNELWAIDTANQIIYRFQDILCKVGPSPQAPEAGAIIPIGSSGYVTSLTLSWEEQPRARTYEAAIYLDSDATETEKVWSGNCTTTGITAAGGASPAQLISNTIYYWRVRSIAPMKSPWSDTWSFTPALGTAQWSPLAAIATVAPSPGATNVPIRPVFAWSSAAGANGYEFVLARNSEFTNLVVARTGADALPTAVWGCDRDLDYSATYFWRVRAITSTSYSKWGASAFTTKVAPTTAPTTPPLPQSPPPQTSSPQPSSPSPPLPESMPLIPSYLLWVVIGIGVALVIALLVLVVRTSG